tara:strand:+ start:29674 stop:29895 length:222 start_codon:yes stop_codon:yes gene_type:complete
MVISSIIKSVGKVSEVFKEGQRQKKWSAKRSVSGILVTACISDMGINGLSELNVILSFIAVLPLCFSVFSRNN